MDDQPASEDAQDDELALSLQRAVVGIVVGCLVTIPAVVVAIGSAGGGHGSDLVAKFLFPYVFLLHSNNDATYAWLGLLQYPVYGAILAFCGKRWNGATVVILVHVVFVGFSLLRGA